MGFGDRWRFQTERTGVSGAPSSLHGDGRAPQQKSAGNAEWR